MRLGKAIYRPNISTILFCAISVTVFATSVVFLVPTGQKLTKNGPRSGHVQCPARQQLPKNQTLVSIFYMVATRCGSLKNDL
jgi:hypothetical protein